MSIGDLCTGRTIVLIDGISCTLEFGVLVGVLVNDGTVEQLVSKEFVSLVMAGGEEEMAEWSM